MSISEKKQKLNDTVVTIELTLLSVIQGVGLYFLADNARQAVLSVQYEYWIYIVIAALLFLIFWAQALVHVLSFVSWPIEFIHNFLYFFVVISEVLLFASITDPLRWFGANAFFFLISGLLYYADLWLLISKKENFQTENQKVFYERILKDQKFILSCLVPIGFIFSLVSWLLILFYPTFFLQGHWHIALATLESLFGISSFFYLLSLFKNHISLIEFL